jgi:hypothetical protein
LVELMMVSGVPTASGYEERIRFAEMEVVDRQADEKGLTMNAPSGHFINGWDVNVAGVRTTSVKKHLRYHTHAVRTFARCVGRELTVNARNTFSGSNRAGTEISISAVDTQTLYNYTSGYVWSFRARSSLHFLARTRKMACYTHPLRMMTM